MCWHKFTNYMEVESREVPVSVEQPILTPENAEKFIDENTIGRQLLPVRGCIVP